MKKLLVVLLALTVVGAFVFAEDAAKVSVGAWGRMYVSPFTYDGTNSTVTAGPSWAGNGGRISVDFAGSTENMGFEWNPGVSNNTMTAVCDQAKIWTKIGKFAEIQLGEVQGDTLRGKIDDSGDVVATTGKDNIFQRFYPKTGMLLELTPVDGLYIAAAIDAAQTTTAAVDNSASRKLIEAMYAAFGETVTDAELIAAYPSLADTAASSSFPTVENAFKAIQVGAGYTIKDIGLARVQYIGTASDTGTAYIQAAFAYTGLKGLTADVGAKIATNADFQDTIAGGLYFDQDALHAYANVAASVAGSASAKFDLQGTASFYYDVAAPASVGLEGSFAGLAADQKLVNVMPAVKLGYSNGYLKAGFDAIIGLDGQDFSCQVPIQLEYWF